MKSIVVIVGELACLAEARAKVICSELAELEPELVDYAEVAASAHELFVLLESVAALQQVIEVALCPKCGYRFLDDADRAEFPCSIGDPPRAKRAKG